MNKKNILITGGAGFVGSNLCNLLCNNKNILGDSIESIVVIDNLSLGELKFIQPLIDSKKVIFYKEDLLNFEEILNIFEKHKFNLVFHLSANSDIGYGAKFTDWDLKQGTLATYNVLECMRKTDVKEIIFSSTSAIYGEATIKPTPENYGPLLPISFYGASKLACEGIISSFCHNFDFKCWIYRFGNIVGRNGTHGVIIDFIKKLRYNEHSLEILGDGKQAKPYLHVDDCIEGIVFGYKTSDESVNFFNLAYEGATSVAGIAKIVVASMGLQDVEMIYTGGARGWKGDVPQVTLDTQKLSGIGWKASLSSDEAVEKAVDDLLSNN